MRSCLLTLCLLSTLGLALAATTASAPQKKAWITVGDAAFRQVKAVAPDAVSISNRQVRVGEASEKVHAVVLDDSKIAGIAGAIHQRLGRCGGFMYHASEAEACAALEVRRSAVPVPVYAIDQREVLEPILASMQEKQIEATILALSGFTNRYYTSPSGVEAANWLLSAWRELAVGREDISVALVFARLAAAYMVELSD